MKKRINIYRNAGEWCYALFIGDEFDSSDTIDAESETDAREEMARQFPGAQIERVSDTAVV